MENETWDSMTKNKFMMSLDDEIRGKLETIAEKQGIKLQELLRARVVPEWFMGPEKLVRLAYGRGYKAGSSRRLEKNGNGRNSRNRRAQPETARKSKPQTASIS